MIYLNILLFICGIILITKCGDLFIDGACYLADAAKIPKIVFGATILSLATTLPELLVSSLAAYQGSNEIAIGNAIGSVICNTALILGLSIFLAPQKVKRQSFILKAGLLLASAFVFFLFVQDLKLSVTEGLFLFLFVLTFFALNLKESKDAGEEIDGIITGKGEFFRNIAVFSLGAVGVVVGARLLVDNGIGIARALSIPEAIIGLTIISIGTSLPEFVATIAAIVKKEPSLSVGNIIGANLLNITMVLPVCSLLSKNYLSIDYRTIVTDGPALWLVLILAFLPPILTGRFYRLQGVALLLTYGIYVCQIAF